MVINNEPMIGSKINMYLRSLKEKRKSRFLTSNRLNAHRLPRFDKMYTKPEAKEPLKSPLKNARTINGLMMKNFLAPTNCILLIKNR